MKSGQALVLVMMILSVALTVGLSVAMRSTNEVRISSSQEESARALEAAESGLEKALGGTLVGGGGPQPTLGSGARFVIYPTPTSGARLSEFVLPFQLLEGQTATIDLRNYIRPSVDSSKVRFCWGSSSSTLNTKLAVDLYYSLASGEVRIGKQLFDPAITNYTNPGQLNQCPNNMGAKFTYRADFGTEFNVPNEAGITLIMFRLKTLGNLIDAEPVAVKAPGGDFGRQGSEYTSVGSAGNSTQKVRGVDLNYDLPSIFDNAIYSGTNLIK